MRIAILRTIISIILIAGSIAGAHAQNKGIYTCTWHQKTEGMTEEQLIDQMQFHEKSKFSYMITNDDEQLYIILILADRAVIQKAMRFGMTTWINPDGKKKKGMGILFPLEVQGPGEHPVKRGQGAQRQDMMANMMVMKNKEMVLLGFGGKNERIKINPGTDPFFHGKVEMLPGERLKVSLDMPLKKIGRGPADSRGDNKRKNMFAGSPSRESKSTPFLLTPKQPTSFLAQLCLPWGIAIPWPIAVEPNASRANKISMTFFLSFLSIDLLLISSSTSSSITPSLFFAFISTDNALAFISSLIFMNIPPIISLAVTKEKPTSSKEHGLNVSASIS